jgi:hypothetical protein
MRTKNATNVTEMKALMGSGRQSDTPIPEESVDAWLDLFNEIEDSEPPQKPLAMGHPGRAQEVGSLQEFASKITPVSLTPVQHLLPSIEPVVPFEDRDVWEVDEREATRSFFTTPPPETETSDEIEFDLEEAPQHGGGHEWQGSPWTGGQNVEVAIREGNAPYRARLTPPSTSLEESLDEAPEVDFEIEQGFSSRLIKNTHVRSSRPPMQLPDPHRIQASTPMDRGLFSIPPKAPPEDNFDLSDFDRWGSDSTPEPTTTSPSPVPAPPAPSTVSELESAFTSGEEFLSSPDQPELAEALTVPRMSDGSPLVAHQAVRARESLPQEASQAIRSSTIQWSNRPSAVPDTAPAISSDLPPPRISNPSLGKSENNAYHPTFHHDRTAWEENPTPMLPPKGATTFAVQTSNRISHEALHPELEVSDDVATPVPNPSRAPSASAVVISRPGSPSTSRTPKTETAPGARIAPPPLPAKPPSKRSSPEQEMNERFDIGDFEGALQLAEAFLEVNPDDRSAQHIAEVCNAKLRAIFISRLGSLEWVPVLSVSPGQLKSIALDNRAGFLLSLVDGFSSIENILDISPMGQLETLRTLHQLVSQNIVTLRR